MAREKDLLRELQNIRYALDQSSIVAITDVHGVIQYVNDKFVEISKYSRKELIGKTHRVINSKYHSKEYIKNLWDTIKAGKIWRGELRNQAKDGTYYWVDTTITPLLGEDGKPKQFIAIRNDITQRKLLEQQKDEFMAVASHELKTPLTSLKAYLQLLQRKLKGLEDEAARDLVEKSNRQVEKLTSLIHDLLDVTKIEAGKLQLNQSKFKLNELITYIVEDVQSVSDGHEIAIELDGDPELEADRERIGQVLTNLVTNAVKYSPQSKQVNVRSRLNSKRVEVWVRDYGVGIPANDRERVFDKYFRSNSHNSINGLGLGLYISAEIIKRHGGTIWVESEEGKGSTFIFSLPLSSFDS